MRQEVRGEAQFGKVRGPWKERAPAARVCTMAQSEGPPVAAYAREGMWVQGLSPAVRALHRCRRSPSAAFNAMGSVSSRLPLLSPPRHAPPPAAGTQPL